MDPTCDVYYWSQGVLTHSGRTTPRIYPREDLAWFEGMTLPRGVPARQVEGPLRPAGEGYTFRCSSDQEAGYVYVRHVDPDTGGLVTLAGAAAGTGRDGRMKDYFFVAMRAFAGFFMDEPPDDGALGRALSLLAAGTGPLVLYSAAPRQTIERRRAADMVLAFGCRLACGAGRSFPTQSPGRTRGSFRR